MLSQAQEPAQVPGTGSAGHHDSRLVMSRRQGERRKRRKEEREEEEDILFVFAYSRYCLVHRGQ
jgi:hypothetical protein